MATDNEVLLKLVMRGMNPAEAQRVASQTHQALEAELRASMGRQVAAHRQAAEATTKEAVKAAEAQKKEAAAFTAAVVTAIRHREAEDKRSAAEAVRTATQVEQARIRSERAASAAAVAAARTAEREAVKAAKERERADTQASRSAEAAARKADRETQAMGRAHAAAIAENMRRDAAAAHAFEQNQAKMVRAATQAANANKTSFRRMMEDLENISVVASAAWNIISGGAGRLKHLAEEIVRTTNIFQSFKGSLGEAREAVEGTVSDMDLIISKNRALEMGLELTDRQFADVAATADKFADVIGTDAGDALNQLISGLATGRTRTLQMAGVVIDASNAHEKFAKSIGTTSDKLNDQGKRIAIQNQALEQMAEKASEAAKELKGPANMALLLEQGLTGAKNVWDAFVAELGQWQPPAGLKSFLNELQNLPFSKSDRFALEQIKQAKATIERGLADSRAAKAAQERAANSGLPPGTSREDFIEKAKPGTVTYASPSTVTGVDRLFAAQEIRAQEELDRIRADAEEGQLDRLMSDATGGLGDADIQKRIDQMDKEAEAMIAKGKDIGERLRQEMEDTYERAGGRGIFSTLLWGPNGPDETYAEMDGFERAVVDSMGILSEAGQGMAQAFGNAFASAIEGEKSFAQAMKDGVRQVLRSLVAEAATRAVMETALGIASLALGPIGGVSAAGHFAAAGVFASVAGVAGVGLRAIGPAPSGAGARPTENRSQTFASAPSSRSSNDNASRSPVVINVTVNPGGEAEAGRAILEAMKAYKAQSGRDPIQILSAA